MILRQRRAEGLHSESMSEEKLLTLKEAAQYLGLEQEEVRDFVVQEKIPAYKLGGEFLRFRKDQLEALKDRIQILKKSTAKGRIISIGGEGRIKYSLWERIGDFIYFNNFYFFAAIVIIILLFIVLRYK